MKKISVKLALFFISLICVSSILSFFTSIVYTYNVNYEMKQDQELISNFILELHEKTDLSINEILEITPNSMYNVEKLEDIELLEINKEQLEKLQNNEIIYMSGGQFASIFAVMMIDNHYIKINLHPHNNILKIVGSRTWVTITSFILTGALLIVLFGRKAVKPIVDLTYATKEVAKGNFDIQVENSSNDEVGQLTQNFNKMTRELKNIEYLRKDFISNVSHEFKTPIASIQGFAKLLQNGNLSEEEKEEYTDIIVEETARLSNLSSNILKISKLENQEILEQKVKFSLDEQIRKCILLLEYNWSKKNIEFDIDLDKIEYLGDEELLQQVWINLISNSIKFSHDNGKIDISLKNLDSHIEVKVIDYGIGMSKETANRIFEKFYQGDKAHSSEGNGLGLSLVKRILDICGGSITVESELNKQTSFIANLPHNK